MKSPTSVTQSCKVDALILRSASNVFYVGDYPGEDCSVVCTSRRAYLVTDMRYAHEARERLGDRMEVVLADGRGYRQLRDLALADGAKSVGWEDTVPYREYTQLESAFRNTGCELVPISDAMDRCRDIKQAYEIERIERAQEITDRAYEQILPYLTVGVTELETVARLDYILHAAGAKNAFDTIVAFGANGCSPHAHPSDKQLCSGEFVTMDFGAKYQGYCSDMTRTVAVGAVSDRQANLYEAVLQAQQAALDGIRAGMTGREADAIARSYFAKHGLDGYFTHSLGHGLGVDIHEGTGLTPRCDTELAPNMVVSVEPGLYLDGVCGIRIEDIVVIEERGVRNLTRSNKKLTIL